MGCGSDDTVVVNAVDATTASELVQLEAALNGFDKAMAATMTAFNDVIIAIDKVSHIYSNLSIVCSDSVKEHQKSFDQESRGMQEKGLYAAFNQDVITGSITPFNSLKTDIKNARKTLEAAKKAQADYEGRRKKIEAKEAEYAKKGKQVAGNSDYQKQLKERDQKKAAHEKERKNFETQMKTIRSKVNQTVIKSSSNYANSAQTFFAYVTKVIEVFGDESKPTKLTALINGYKAPTLPAVVFDDPASPKKEEKPADAGADAEKPAAEKPAAPPALSA